MKRIFLLLGFIVCTKLYALPFVFVKHENVWLEPKKNLFQYVQTGEFYNEELQGYIVDESLFVTSIAAYPCTIYGEDIKNEQVVANFTFDVYSKDPNLYYCIKDVKIISDDIEADLENLIYKFYPYNEIKKTDFQLSKENHEFYKSKVFFGFFKFPCKKNKELKINVTLETGKEKKNVDFLYSYIVKKSRGFIRLND